MNESVCPYGRGMFSGSRSVGGLWISSARSLKVSLPCRCYCCKEIAICFNNNETQALHRKRGKSPGLHRPLLGPPSLGALSGMPTATSRV